jgi:hypothetical protein
MAVEWHLPGAEEKDEGVKAFTSTPFKAISALI